MKDSRWDVCSNPEVWALPLEFLYSACGGLQKKRNNELIPLFCYFVSSVPLAEWQNFGGSALLWKLYVN